MFWSFPSPVNNQSYLSMLFLVLHHFLNCYCHFHIYSSYFNLLCIVFCIAIWQGGTSGAYFFIMMSLLFLKLHYQFLIIQKFICYGFLIISENSSFSFYILLFILSFLLMQLSFQSCSMSLNHFKWVIGYFEVCVGGRQYDFSRSFYSIFSFPSFHFKFYKWFLLLPSFLMSNPIYPFCFLFYINF